MIDESYSAKGDVSRSSFQTGGGAMKIVRAKVVDKALRMVWASMESHLDWTHQKIGTKAPSETNAFHKKCVKEYAELMRLISLLY